MELNIRKMRSSDVQSLYELLSDEKVMKYLEKPFSFEQTELFLKEKALCEPPFIYAIDEENNGFIGYVIYHDYDDDHIEIGWVLKPSSWNKGYAKRITATLIEMAFNEDKNVIIECSKQQDATRRIAQDYNFELIKTEDDLEIYELRKTHDLLKEIDVSLREYVINKVLPEYEDYEKSHGPEHIRRVIDRSLLIAKNMDVDINMVYCAAAYHDIGLRFGRDDHEITSARWLMKDVNLKKWFSDEQIIVMSEAIEDHRASSQREPRSVYGLIISEADRDIEPKRVIRRCVEYECATHPNASVEEKLSRILTHIVHKYGPDGYVKLRLQSDENKKGLETIREWIRDDKLKDICKNYLIEYIRKQL